MKEYQGLTGTSGTLYPFSGKSYEKIVQEKDPGNDSQCAGCAGRGNMCQGRNEEMKCIAGIFLFHPARYGVY